MRSTKRFVASCLAGAAMLGTVGAEAQSAEAQSADSGWQFEVTPYFYAAGLDGKLTVRGVEADVDAKFEDIFDTLDLALMGTIEARRGRFGLLFDGLYFKLQDEASRSWSGPAGIGSATGELEASATMQLYQLAVAYRLGEGAAIDLVAGGRYTRLDTDLDLTVTTGGLLPGGTRSVSGDQSWWDPIIGARVVIPFAQRWTAVLYGDVGGFGVGADLTYQVIAGLTWRFAEHFSLKAGYRYLYQDYEDADEGFKWDMVAYGPYLGFGIRF